MRRLVFVSNLFPDTREPYRGLDNATLLHALAPSWEIHVLSPRPTLPWQMRSRTCRPEDRAFEPQFIPTPYVPKIGSRVNHRLMARALLAPLRRVSPFDAVLVSWLFPDACAVAHLAREQGFPFVAIAQGSDVHQYLRHPVRRRLIIQSTERARAVLPRSGELARLLVEAGAPPTRVWPVYNGVDHATFGPGSRPAARQKLGWPEDTPTILFVGNFYPIKNPLGLVEAWAAVCAQPGLAATRLVLAGGGPLERALRLGAQRAGLAGQLQLAGRQDAAGIARLMQAADVLALPSDNEGVPNVILEAFSCGLPVVASRVGGIPEVHDRPALGALVPPRDPAALAHALGEVLRQRPAPGPIAVHGAHFRWEETARQVNEALG